MHEYNPFKQQLLHSQQAQTKPQAAAAREPEETKGPAKPAVPSNELKLLVLADREASFMQLGADDSTLERVDSLPRYPNARAARFAPLEGKQAAVVDELGMHFVSMETGAETLFVAQENLETLKYSPADSYVVTCEKFSPQSPDNLNLRILCAQSGRQLAAFPWRKASKESLRTVVWAPDERVCIRMAVTPAPQINYIEVFRNGNFEAPAVTI